MSTLEGKRTFCITVIILCFGVSDFSLAFAEEFRYDSHGKHDPFMVQSVGFTEAGHQIGHSDLRLEGVIIDQAGSSYAIVNSQIVKQGDLFEGYLLKKIETNRVFFEKDGESFEVILHEDDEALKEYLKSGNS